MNIAISISRYPQRFRDAEAFRRHPVALPLILKRQMPSDNVDSRERGRKRLRRQFVELVLFLGETPVYLGGKSR